MKYCSISSPLTFPSTHGSQKWTPHFILNGLFSLPKLQSLHNMWLKYSARSLSSIIFFPSRKSIQYIWSWKIECLRLSETGLEALCMHKRPKYSLALLSKFIFLIFGSSQTVVCSRTQPQRVSVVEVWVSCRGRKKN